MTFVQHWKKKTLVLVYSSCAEFKFLFYGSVNNAGQEEADGGGVKEVLLIYPPPN